MEMITIALVLNDYSYQQFSLSTEKKCTTSKLGTVFHSVDKTEDLSLGHNISDSSERLL